MCLLFVPEGHPVTTTTLAATLHQIAALDKIPREAVQAIRAAAYLLDEMDKAAIASTARDVVNDQLTYMNEELKSMTDHFRATLESETEKHAAILAETTRGLMSNSKKSYKDALLDNLSAVRATADDLVEI